MKLQPFEPNDYRKRVLAAVEARGGPAASDPFELYDIPLEHAERVADRAVAERVDEVWAFWQRQRDHPKYRALVAALVAAHDANTAGLRDSRSRGALAARVRQQRAGREAARYELLDAAISALVARYRGIPRDRLPRLEEVGRDSGLSPAEVAARLRMHRLVDAAPAPAPAAAPAAEAGAPDHRRHQVRALLDELGRIWECPPPVTLFALLGCDPDAPAAEIAACAAGWRARARELPSDRLRTVVDELLVHVGDLLESGPERREAYLDGVAADVAEKLRPRVRAAVLVEDRLTADDHAHLAAEAAALGLDAGRAARVLARLAAEFGVPVDLSAPAAPVAAPRPTSRPWEAPLRAARAALRAGRPVEAQRLAEDARRAALPERQAPVTAVADEIEAVLAEARLRWRAAAAALAARRYAEAAGHLEHLTRAATDVPHPQGSLDAARALAEARAAVAEADRRVAAAAALPPADRAAALLGALAVCPEHPGALGALALLPLAGPARVRAERGAAGDVTVSWEPAPEPAVTYKVTRLEPDGTWRAVGRTSGASVTDGGAPPGPGTPVYAVAALQPGRASEAVRSDAPGAAPAPDPAAPALAAPRDVRAERGADGSVVVTWAGPADVEYQVARQAPDGSWRVLGRTRATSMEDGGAPAGPLPAYGVVARSGPAASARAVSPPDGVPAVEALSVDGAGRLLFAWPAGVTEVMVVLRAGAEPAAPDDPAATAWKVTNTRYAIDGGVPLPPRTDDGPRHVAVATCRRVDGRLVVAPGFAPGARLVLPPPH